MPDTILIVDDEPAILSTLSAVLRDEGYLVHACDSGSRAFEVLEHEGPELVLLDIWMPDLDGIEVLKKIRRDHPESIVIMMSGHGSIETAVKATKLGAYDYIEKPLSLEKVHLLVRHALREHRLEEENVRLRSTVEKRGRLIGTSAAIRRLRGEIETAGPTNSRVLITGENGTGKELVARAIHEHSPRARQPFLEVNCAAIPETLIESELFGHERGAFTGAAGARRGQFELAHGGTLFLDEIGDMAPVTQSKVLRVLQEQRFFRIGGKRPIQVDVRLIAATNKDLAEEIRQGRFREDLFYRLNVIRLQIPPLRERREDIPLLLRHFVQELAAEQGVRPKEIEPEAVGRLCAYDWPGNVRELRNTVERLLIMVPHDPITAGDLEMGDTISVYKNSPDGEGAPGRLPGGTLREARTAFERQYIRNRLAEHQWNVSRTAEALGIERTHLHRKIRLLGIAMKAEE